MAAPLWFQKIAREGRAQGFRPSYITQGHPVASQAIEWFRQRASAVRAVDTKRIVTETPSRMVSRLNESYVGNMLMFGYRAKWRETLPYWDAFPLVFPIEFQGDRMLSLNLHYLPPLLRARLMDQLYSLIENESNTVKRLGLSYQILNNAARFAAFRPCIKTHLFSHVQSQFFWVRHSEWDMALFLPTARFQKATQETVWGASERMLQGH